MKFTRLSSCGHGVRHTPLNPEDYIMLDRSNLQYFTVLRPTVLDAQEWESDKRKRIEMLWYYIIGLKGVELIGFHAEKSYYIDESDVAPTKESIQSIIFDSHKHLQHSFEEIRKEFIIISPIEDISDDATQQTVLQLQEVLLSELK